MVTQELAAIPARTVVENVFLGHGRARGDARRNFGTAYRAALRANGDLARPAGPRRLAVAR